jgi:chromosome segregation ATPase
MIDILYIPCTSLHRIREERGANEELSATVGSLELLLSHSSSAASATTAASVDSAASVQALQAALAQLSVRVQSAEAEIVQSKSVISQRRQLIAEASAGPTCTIISNADCESKSDIANSTTTDTPGINDAEEMEQKETRLRAVRRDWEVAAEALEAKRKSLRSGAQELEQFRQRSGALHSQMHALQQQLSALCIQLHQQVLSDIVVLNIVVYRLSVTLYCLYTIYRCRKMSVDSTKYKSD